MAKYLLQAERISPVADVEHGEGVTQRVRRDAHALDAGLAAVGGHGLAHAAAVETKVELPFVPDVALLAQFSTHLPVYSLAAAASGFSDEQEVRPLGWMPVSIGRRLDKTMFVAKVKGRSMEPLIKDGSWCVFRKEKGGTRNGKVVLVESRHISDPDEGRRYTVKVYHSEMEYFDDGTWLRAS